VDKNKILLLGGIVLVVGLLLGFVYLIFQNNQFNKTEQEPEIANSPTPSPIPLETYQNPSGFEFQYPQTFYIDERDNPKVYADILILSDSLSGQMSIKVTDTKLENANEWLKQESILPKANERSQILFADIDAVQVATPGGMMAVAVDQGALFVIRLDWMKDKVAWQKAYENFLSTFAFIAPTKSKTQQSPASSSTGGDNSLDIIFEGEEIIE